MFDLLIRNGLTVTPEGPKKLSVAVKDGKIAGLFDCMSEIPAKETFDFTGKIIFPGVIDSHAHVTYCSDFFSGSRTAASGGVTTLVEMPQSGHLPAIWDESILKQRIASIDETSVVDCALYGGVKANHMEHVEELIKGGVVGFKVFLSDAGDYGSFDDASLRELLRIAHNYGCLVAVHAESQSICTMETQKIIAAGQGTEKNSDSRPVISEVLAVSRLCTLALHEHAPVSICHISSGQVTDIIQEFREKHLQVFAETCPHYLLLNSEDVIRCGAWAKCAPPLRDPNTADELWTAILTGKIDMIGSDHATYTDVQKSEGSFWSAPGGFPGLDLILPGLFDEGVLRRGLSLNSLAQITAANPAKIFGLDTCKGSITVGKDADFAVLDPEFKWVFHAADTFYDTKSPHYPYEGKTFQGKVISTFVRGKQVYKNGKILAERHGKYIPASR